MASIVMRILPLIQIGIVHSFIEFFLRQTFRFCFSFFSPEFVSSFMT